SDMTSLMYWGLSIMAPVHSFQRMIERELILFFFERRCPPQVGALIFPVVGYFKTLSILAQASATLLLGRSMPGNVAQPPFSMNASCFHESVALSSAMVALAAAACWKLSTQIGASTDT